MADLLRLLFLVPLGYIAAVLAAAATVLAGWYGHEPGILNDAAGIGMVIGSGFGVLLQIGALAFIPAAVVIVLAELFGWRSIVFYVLAGGALGLLGDQLWDTTGEYLLLPAAGFVGGFAYWLVAGRLAGLARAPEPPPAPPPPPTSPG